MVNFNFNYDKHPNCDAVVVTNTIFYVPKRYACKNKLIKLISLTTR
jgi:hypothetical protein